MDIASLVGLLFCLAMFLLGVVTSGGITSLPSYWDLPSIAITIGGSFASVLAGMSFKNFINGIKSFGMILRVPQDNTTEMIQNIINLSNVARKEGLLSLEEAAGDLDDEFLKKGILLIVDGTDPELVRAIMETELVSMDSRHKATIGFWESVAGMGPAWGMIGTLLGLIAMLNKLSDPSAIGPQMSVALVTTLYGSLIANWLCAPIAGKLSVNNDMEVVNRQITIEGLLSIQAGENPRVIEEKLKSFLSPTVREGVLENGGGGEE